MGSFLENFKRKIHLIFESSWVSLSLLLCIGIVFVFSSFEYFSERSNTRKNIYKIYNKFEFIKGDIGKDEFGKLKFSELKTRTWNNMDLLISNSELQKVADESFLWMRFDVSEVDNWDHTSSLLQYGGVAYQIFNDSGDLLGQMGDLDVENPVFNQKEFFISWVKLNGKSEKYLYLRILHQKGYLYLITPQNFSMGSVDDITTQFLRDQIPLIALSSFFLFIGLAVIVISLINWKKNYKLSLEFGSFAFLFGLIGFLSNPVMNFLVKDLSYFFTLLIMANSLFLIPMLIGLRRLFGSKQWGILNILISIHLVVSIVTITAALCLNISPLAITYFIHYRFLYLILVLFTFLSAIYVSFRAWKNGHPDGLGNFVGLALTFICIPIEVLLELGNDPSSFSFVQWGVLIGVIAQGFNLERNIFEKRKMLQKAENDLKESKFRNLQSKMNPHFLFNSLNTIHALYQVKPELISDAILKLANNYRFFLDQSNRDLIPFAEEWGFLDDYLHLQKLRFYDTLTINQRLDCSFEDVRLPPLILQPIIENSFKHGFRTQSKTDHILNIHALRDSEKSIRINISDNGKGMKIDESINLEEQIFSRSLGEVRQRIKWKLPGSELFVQSEPGRGFMVTMILVIP
ncbi:sensor histidine kinase [Leptospira sp. GIMC2001]|uniref:sensor histidine kinase n=1 Tax=Leptospira sp. GIMC2001 TaxID=1513297 RepID=UPI002349A849|nr:histidine kinase [Leptospira sp. GIMC2001]WCL48935.1 histidine kinase [Leptospira sp. GIMC2001]